MHSIARQKLESTQTEISAMTLWSEQWCCPHSGISVSSRF